MNRSLRAVANRTRTHKNTRKVTQRHIAQQARFHFGASRARTRYRGSLRRRGEDLGADHGDVLVAGEIAAEDVARQDGVVDRRAREGGDVVVGRLADAVRGKALLDRWDRTKGVKRLRTKGP